LSLPLDLRLYLVTDPVLIGTRPLADVVLAAVRGGVTCVQLRDKDASDEHLVRQAAELLDVLRPTGVPLIVNDRVEVARRVAAAGVHVGVHDVTPREARDILGPEPFIGWSIERAEQLGDQKQLAACTYVAASPVWGTPTKTDTARPWGVSGVQHLRSLTTLPFIGIGGIDAGRAREVIEAGADGVAVVSAILAAADPEKAAYELRTAVDAALTLRGRSQG
jgi:thiamine-phosphate pyrophosphorylase